MNQEITLQPIGVMKCDYCSRYETPRQGVLGESIKGVIELNPGCNYEQALSHLDGFSHIWVIFLFHLNETTRPARPMVRPPRHAGRQKVGVFATRSPHRPNPIGMSCLKLKEISGRRLYVSGLDILDGSPILDIKPYLPYSDSYPAALTGWVKPLTRYQVIFSSSVKSRIKDIVHQGGDRLDRYARVQLEVEPLNSERKRIRVISDQTPKRGELSYQDWRLSYRVIEGDEGPVEVPVVEVDRIWSINEK